MYPLKFKPILKSMLWGGKKLPHTYGLPVDDNTTVGESFLISGLAQDTSVVANGEYAGQSLVELIDTHQAQLLGSKVYEQHGNRFPLLMKIIDAADDLSIQVHPGDELAKAKHGNDHNGKTEMWYVVDADEGASLISGFTRQTSAEEFKDFHDNGRLMELMHLEPVTNGDTFFIPAGKVHSIGKGNLIAEIQQTSDLTYRIYDFDRRDKAGNLRELHHDLAYAAMNYADVDTGKVDASLDAQNKVNLADCQYFVTNLHQVSQPKQFDYANLDSFVAYILVEGRCAVNTGGDTVEVNALESVLIPAVHKQVQLQPLNGDCKLLEVYFPNN